jgi:tetratricopeptide (TPR) repeat protein
VHGDDPDRERPDSTVIGRRSPSPSGSEAVTAIDGAHSSPATAPPAFEPGALIANRYRVLRFVARGGMGNVYEVEDEDLGTRVALKTIRTERDPLHHERVRREINLARQVTHPNVCRIFDMGRHDPAPDDEGSAPITFLTMELLEGETLARRLRRDGPLDIATAQSVAAALAAGLDAAHRAGVIHRDLKSANVVLSPDGERVTITDFGLARATNTETTLDGDALIGTPAYMAPEQVTGETTGPWTDIYAFGVVLYEMVTGRVPFEGDSMVSTAVQRLQQPPPPPREWTPDLPGLWESAILTCLERDPKRRFPTAGEAVAATAGQRPTRRRAPLGGRTWLWAGAAAGALAAALASILLLGPADDGTPGRPSVAVLGLNNLAESSEMDWLSTALGEMLTTELAAGGTLRTAPGEAVATVRRDLSLAPGDTLTQRSLSRVHALLGSDYVVMGSFMTLDDASGSLRVELHVQDARTGDTLASIREHGSTHQLFDLVESAGDATLDALGIRPLTDKQRRQFRASMPAQPEAARLYAQGLEQLRLADAASARATLERATAAAPDFPLAHAARAAAWDALGHDREAREAAERASQLSEPLPRHERLAVQARACEVTRDWTGAIEIYRSLLLFFPESLEHGLRLAACQTRSGDPEAALHTIERLRQLPEPAGSDPRLDLTAAEAAMAQGDFATQLEVAQRALTAGSHLGARTLVARAELQVAASQRQLGQPEAALEAARSARAIFADTGDRAGAIEALNTIAVLKFDQGDLPGAGAIWEETLALCRELGHTGGVARALHNLANVALLSGALGDAEAGYEEALAAFREVGNQRHAAAALTNLATVRFSSGDSDAAVATLEDVLEIQRELGDRAGEATVLNNMAEMLAVGGQLDRAAGLYTEAQEMAQAIGQRSLHAAALSGAGLVATAQGRLEAAATALESALELQLEIGETGNSARTRIALADALRELDQLSRSETVLRAALESCADHGLGEVEAEAQASLASTLLATGRVDEALAAVERAEQLATHSENIGVRISVATTSARVLASSGATEEASRRIREAVAEAEATGRIGTLLRARLIAGEVAIAAAEPDARTLLRKVEDAARERGYEQIAATAGSLLTSTGSPLQHASHDHP